MKALLSILFLISSVSVFAQADKVAGDYTLKLGKEDTGLFEYNMTLKEDGSFIFHYHSFIPTGNPQDVKKDGKGKWTVQNNLITFSTDKKTDLDEKNTLDFNNSKARFVTKSPRDQTDKVVKTRVRFFESEIPWMKTIDMLKI